METLMQDILKAIKDNTHTHKEELTDVEWKYVDEIEITRDVLTIFKDYSQTKIEEISVKLTKLENLMINRIIVPTNIKEKI